ncbi:hypothetical protein HF1_10530 [Mycoplasma haemofelis str. Langford 1]|uniref:Uncharacterized protein n=1 Tax=Mycoplasma haemofelis (strain Langford 1) TaxID=941640 RepID=E8ZIU0_MYCHL|nr:hypothetical protein [Mycoplasma haemofelis]CBY93061.1 hypothetical protein HF1_10530 [Mycoplasma haemofelis str. Langford 1]
MAYAKILTLGGLTATSGGVAGGAYLYSSGGKEQESPKTLTSSKGKETVVFETSSKKCFIFVAGDVTGSGDSINFTKITQKVEGAEEFLKDKSTSSEQFKKDIKDACSGNKTEINKEKEDFRVYVYKNGDNWNYTQHMQKQDWANNPEIISSSGSILNS